MSFLKQNNVINKMWAYYINNMIILWFVYDILYPWLGHSVSL